MKRLFLFLAALYGWYALSGAQTIDLRMSIHLIVHPTLGTPFPGLSNQIFYAAVSNANRVMETYSRGYRYRITEITNVGGPLNGGSSGPSQWYGRDFTPTNLFIPFQLEAETNSQYRLRPDQINIYIATGVASLGNSGGGTPIPPKNLHTGVQIFPDGGSWWVLHELGHFFGLYHTFAGEDQANCTPGNDDQVSDTMADSNCWQSQDDVAQYYFHQNYGLLGDVRTNQVDDIYFDVMSYHDAFNKNATETRKTEMQLDREADHASGDRNPFASGKSYFVSTGGTAGGSGVSTNSLRYPSQAVAKAAAGGGDIILLRPGSYNEPLTINKPVTLRAPRTGWATIGK